MRNRVRVRVRIRVRDRVRDMVRVSLFSAITAANRRLVQGVV